LRREAGGLVSGDISREHWGVPVQGLTLADPDGIVRMVACRDGSVTLHLTCSGTQGSVRLDISRAAQLSTGIWEAAGASQLQERLGDDRPPPQPPCTPTGSGDSPVAWRSHPHRGVPPRSSSPGRRRGQAPRNEGAAVDAEEARTIGWRLRRIRQARGKSLRVIAGLAGMSTSSLHRIEHGQRAVTLSEIVALAMPWRSPRAS
jgi:Helix-turn-helix domain